MRALAGALFLLALTNAAWADQRECGNLVGMLRHLNAERTRESSAADAFDRSARHWAQQLMIVSTRADQGDAEARAKLPTLRQQVAHLLASQTASKDIVASIEKAISEVSFELFSKCPDQLKTAPPPSPPQAVVAPPPPGTPSSPSGLAPNQGVYAMKGMIHSCGPKVVSEPVDFAVNDGNVTGFYRVTAGVQRFGGTVDSSGTLHIKIDGDAETMIGGEIIWQNGHWRATGHYTFVTSLFTCSGVWSATQATPS